jgi:uncharacterized protein YhfF
VICPLPDSCSGADASAALTAFVRAASFVPAEIADIYEFGDRPDLIDELAELVVAGPKRATTALLRWYGPGAERLPVPEDLILIVASACRPRAIARVVRVDILPFADVDDAAARDEGEGHRTLASWRAEHRIYFNRETASTGVPFDENESVVFCRFSLVWPPSESVEPTNIFSN